MAYTGSEGALMTFEEEPMIFGLILAGGTGTRMGNVDRPKQFLTIGKKPVIIHTIEKFVMNDKFEEIIVLCPNQWISYTKDLIRKYVPDADRISVVAGGESRNETIMNGIAHIEERYDLSDDTAVVTHDAVRPFVTHRIIEENIAMLKDGKICNTVIPSTDTIVDSTDGESVTSIPDRKRCYLGQTPQSFGAGEFKELYTGLTEEEKSILTDAAKVFVMKGKKVFLVNGETFNIKVTYPYDLQLAETLLGGNSQC